jgi:selenocysteine-specific elongation factor
MTARRETSPERPLRHFILGTAGHVDHGKTELVKALTGVDTDRLKEEKARGISIELGFAPLELDERTFVGVVDVPGHERFVKHMVAGAGGIDFAMLLVAADEGVMPQTQEHMEVLASLGIDRGIVVVSKCDLATSDTMTLLREEIAELTRGSFLEGAPIVETSARTGHGLTALREALSALAEGAPVRPAQGPFRLAVDRVFHSKGIGVVVTGSCYSGAVSVGDALELLPSGKRARVRELQSFGHARERGQAGERLAVALQGVKLDETKRGDMLVTPGCFTATRALDARVHVAGYHAFEIKNRERLRFHHGAREALGRMIILDAEVLRAGQSALVQIRLESPLVPGAGDRFVIRKYSPQRVAGGGLVVDTTPERHRRFDDGALERLRVREAGDPRSMLSKQLEAAGEAGVDAAASQEAAGDLVAAGEALRIADRLYATAAIDALGERIDAFVAQHLDGHPLRWGMDKEELRRRLAFPHGAQAFNRVLDALAQRRALFVREARVRTGTAELALSPAARRAVVALGERVRAAGVAFPSRSELEAAWAGPGRFVDALQLLRETGEVVDVGEGAVHREALGAVIDALRALFSGRPSVSVGDVKTALGLTRKHVIPLLEHFDRLRVTRRRGDERVRGPAFPGEGPS